MIITGQHDIADDSQAASERSIQLEDILDFSPVAIGWSNVSDGRIEYINRAFLQLFGYTCDDIPTLEVWYHQAYPDPEYRATVVAPWIKAVNQARLNGTTPPELEATITRKDGTIRRVCLSCRWIGSRRLVNFNDITGHWIAEQRLRVHSEMLEMVAKGRSLTDILTAIVRQVQTENPASLCSVLLLDSLTQRLHDGVAPDLPVFFNQAVQGVKIGVGVGSCGTAAFLKQRVIVEDILTHDYWKNYRALAHQAGLRACWSDPILGAKGEVLGTFAIYYPFPATPSPKDLELIQFASNLASIAIERLQAHQELERRAYYDYLTGLANRRYFFEIAEQALRDALYYQTPLSMLMMDVDHFKRVNDVYGHKVGDQVLQVLATVTQAGLRPQDHIGRIGGEEFAILLPDTDFAAAIALAERLRITLASTPVVTSVNESVTFTVSLGVAVCQHDCCSIDDLLSEADKALYCAKTSGRNRTSHRLLPKLACTSAQCGTDPEVSPQISP